LEIYLEVGIILDIINNVFIIFRKNMIVVVSRRMSGERWWMSVDKFMIYDINKERRCGYGN
jgi:hypothetical protein